MRRLFRLLWPGWSALQARESVLVRPLRPEDIPWLFPEPEYELARQWLARQEQGEIQIAVAEVGGEPVGRRGLDFLSGSKAGAVFCFAASVLERWRSRGIGTLLDRHSEAVARARGFHALRAAVSKTNIRGLAWHDRLGYCRIDQRIERWHEPDGEHVADCWLVERRWADRQSFFSRFITRRLDRTAVKRVRRRRRSRAGSARATIEAPVSREAILRLLNEQYVKASLAGDVEWYRAHLAEEFVCIESDGTVLDKEAFLRMTAGGSDLAEYRLDQVDIRFYGDVAVVRALGSWTAKNGTPGLSRYVDVYALIGDEWKAVSAQITRPAPTP